MERDLQTARIDSMERRLQHAARLLRTGASVADAAQATQTSGRRFRLLFARRFGSTPVAYKREHGQGRDSQVVPFRVRSPAELRALRSAARKSGCTVSTYVYRLVRRHLRLPQNSSAAR